MNKITILVYHQTRDNASDPMTIDLKTFKQHMSFLKDNFEITSLGKIVEEVNKNNEITGDVAITFDDGYKSNYLYALPILESYDFPATFFIVTSYVNKSPQFMSWEQIKELIDKGYEIGSHTVSHRKLSGLKLSSLKKEIINSKMILENNLGRKVALFAYPFGKERDITKEVIDLIRSHYKCCCSTSGYAGISKREINLYNLERIPINNMKLIRFKVIMKDTDGLRCLFMNKMVYLYRWIKSKNVGNYCK